MIYVTIDKQVPCSANKKRENATIHPAFIVPIPVQKIQRCTYNLEISPSPPSSPLREWKSATAIWGYSVERCLENRKEKVRPARLPTPLNSSRLRNISYRQQCEPRLWPFPQEFNFPQLVATQIFNNNITRCYVQEKYKKWQKKRQEMWKKIKERGQVKGIVRKKFKIYVNVANIQAENW